MQMSDTLVALVAMITSAFANVPTLPGESLVYEDTWETEDLIRDLAAVGDRPDDRFIEQHFSSLPAFTGEGLRHVLPQYLIYSLKHRTRMRRSASSFNWCLTIRILRIGGDDSRSFRTLRNRRSASICGTCKCSSR